MPRDKADLLEDVRAAAEMIELFTAGRGLPNYSADTMLRSAVERQFIIIGEALAQLERVDAATATQITDYPKIIAFRNILVHGYSAIDDQIVWAVIQTNLPALRRQVDTLLSPPAGP